MLITEIFDPTPYGYNSEEEDNSSHSILSSRKTRLTLAHLNRLRILNDVRKLENEKKIEKLQKQYAAAPEGGPPGPGL